MKNVNTKLELPQFSIFNINVRLYKVRENRSGNQENLTTFDTQDTRRSKKKPNTICVGHHYTQTNTNNVNKTCALLQTTGGKDEPNIVCMPKS